MGASNAAEGRRSLLVRRRRPDYDPSKRLFHGGVVLVAAWLLGCGIVGAVPSAPPVAAGDSGQTSDGDGTRDDTGCERHVFHRDGDADGYGTAPVAQVACDGAEAGGLVEHAGDCDDGDPLVSPGAFDIIVGPDDPFCSPSAKVAVFAVLGTAGDGPGALRGTVALADVDGDRFADLLDRSRVVYGPLAGRVDLVADPSRAASLPDQWRDVEPVDMNGDGVLDLLSADHGAYLPGPLPRGAATVGAVDLGGTLLAHGVDDGTLHALWREKRGRDVYLLEGPLPAPPDPAGASATIALAADTSVVAGTYTDYDGDGLSDLVAEFEYPENSELRAYSAWLVPGGTLGTFAADAPPGVFSRGFEDWYQPPVADDLDGDGYEDIVVNVAFDGISVFRGNATDVLLDRGDARVVMSAVDNSPFDAVAVPGDLDGDGFHDLAVGGEDGIWLVPGDVSGWLIVDGTKALRAGDRTGARLDVGTVQGVPVLLVDIGSARSGDGAILAVRSW